MGKRNRVARIARTNQKTQSEGKKAVPVQFKEPGEDAEPYEDYKMEMDGDAGSRKKLDVRTKEITKELRENEDFKNMDENFLTPAKKKQNEKWQKELTQTERKEEQLVARE